jgi:peptidoglycan biosynthesis protein MviN/MurJ (putative lipid II flippase)
MGRSFPNAVFVAIGLSIAFGVNNLTGMGTTVLRAAGRPKYEAYCAVIGTVLNVGITLALAPLFGVRGIVTGTILAEVVTSICFLVIFHRRYPFGWWETVGTWLWRLLGATGVSVGAVLIIRHISSAGLETRLDGILQTALFGAIFLPAFLVALTAFGFWTRDDRDVANRVLRRFHLVRSAP